MQAPACDCEGSDSVEIQMEQTKKEKRETNEAEAMVAKIAYLQIDGQDPSARARRPWRFPSKRDGLLSPSFSVHSQNLALVVLVVCIYY